jgi:hypothetical protein
MAISAIAVIAPITIPAIAGPVMPFWEVTVEFAVGVLVEAVKLAAGEVIDAEMVLVEVDCAGGLDIEEGPELVRVCAIVNAASEVTKVKLLEILIVSDGCWTR